MQSDDENMSMTKDEFIDHLSIALAHRTDSLIKELLYYRILTIIYTLGAVAWILFSI
jgi:hypothetical protein